MAPSIHPSHDVTDIFNTRTTIPSMEYHWRTPFKYRKVETKKERIKRVAKEKMYASWDLHNDKSFTIREIKQICKPHHRLNGMGKRY